MKEYILDTWEDFLKIPTRTNGKGPVYRGQENHEWGLQTTLEREGRSNEAFGDYYRSIKTIQTAIESYTDKRWNVQNDIDYENLHPDQLDELGALLPAYEFMIYLRHHGFPSPFLDWTQSPYVAAFFAFNDAELEKADRCAIFEYSEYGGEEGCRSFCGWEFTPRICTLGHAIRTHKRHYLQQAEYTICVKKTKSEDLVFSPHKEGQCLYVKKYTLPISEKKKALQQLQQMNITAHTLFGTEDALISSLATREYIIKNPRIPYKIIKALKG